MHSWQQLLGSCLLALLLFTPFRCNGQEPHDIAVIYPATEAPYREVVDSILQGIKHALPDGHTFTFVLENGKGASELKPWLTRTSPPAIITLGRQAYEEIKRLGYDNKTVAGALDLTPQHDPNAFGISLAVEPALFFDTLKQLKPSVKRVFVVYNPEKTQWLVDKAKALASKYDLEIAAFPAADMAASARNFRQLLETVRPDLDALWIPFDSTLIDNDLVFPVIVDQAWARRLLVFSNNLTDAQRGAAFAFYLDPQKLGARLAAYSKQTASTGRPAAHTEPLQDVKRAMHLRVARHLDIDIRRYSDGFDLFFPSPNP